MLEKASEFYCDPPIDLTIREWIMKGKMILEVIVPEGFEKPYYAVDEEGKKWVYVRQKDQSLLASKVMVEVLKHKHSSRPVVVQYTSKEKALLEFLKQHPRITMKEYCKLVNISRWRAQKILINLTAVGVVRLHDIEKPEFYTLG
jgi:predicted HTH transcriptional regulator